MIFEQDAVFRLERDQFVLRFTCEDCALWDASRDACAHGFPTREHRVKRYLREDATVLFCKEFELF